MKMMLAMIGCWLILHSKYARIYAHRRTHTRTGDPTEW